MMPKELLVEAAKKKGLTNKEHIEKDYFQDLFLFHLYKKTNRLVFKGGTCLYKLYGLPRFSEDLDFSTLEEKETAGALAEGLVSEVSGKIGAEVKSVKKMESSMIVKLGFAGILTEYNSLRIDINLKNAVFGYDVRQYVPPYIDISPFSMKVLNTKEILAEKVHALFARDKARDMYDLFFLLRFVEPDRELIDRKLDIFGMRFDFSEFEKRVRNLESFWEPELRPFVMAEQLVEFGVAKDFVLENFRPSDSKNGRIGT